MRIYISGKITGLDIKEAQAIFSAKEAALREAGHVPVNPMEEVPYEPDWTWEQYMVEDIRLLLACEAICMLDNWKDSKGARCEHALAEQLGLEIIYS